MERECPQLWGGAWLPTWRLWGEVSAPTVGQWRVWRGLGGRRVWGLVGVQGGRGS